MIRRMMLGLCVVCLCASLADAANPKVAVVPGFDSTEESSMRGGAILVFQPSEEQPFIGTAWVLVVLRGFDPYSMYFVEFERGGLGGYIETNWRGRGYFTGSNEGSLDPTPLPDFFPDNHLLVWDSEGNIVAVGTVE